MKFKLTTTTNKTPDQLRDALHDALGHNADRLLIRPVPPPPTITPHWKDKSWEYIPSTEHANSSKFRERMEKRRIAVQGK